MSYIELCVTQAVVSHIQKGNESQRQIAIKNGSEDMMNLIRTASKINIISIHLNNTFELSVGDTSAIWITHQEEGNQKGDFIDIYSLLARRTGIAVKFECSIT